MATTIGIRKQALGMAVVFGAALTAGTSVNAATQSPASEGPPTALPAPPAGVDALSLPDNPRPGETVYKALPPEDTQARAGHKLPCGLSYYENPALGGAKSVAFTIGNCNNFGVRRAVNFDPDRPTPQSDCMGISPHFTVVGRTFVGENQHVSKRGTGMVACH